jgi:O-antigen ligase
MTAADRRKRDALPLFLTMFWVAGLPVFLLFGNRLLASVSVLKADRVTYLLAAAPVVIGVLRGSRVLQPLGRVEKAMLAYLAVILVSWATTLPSKDLAGFKQDADFILTCFVMPYSAFVIARNTEWTSERLTACLWVLVAGVGGYLLIFGTVQYAHDWNFLVPRPLWDVLPDRARGPFENAVPFGIVLSILVVLALFLYLQARGRLARWTLVAIAFGLVQCIVASKTRAVWIALPLALLLLFVRYRRIRLLAGVLTAAVVVQVLLAPAVGVDPLGLEERLTQVQQVYDRVAVSATASNMAEHRPVFGFGFGSQTFQDDKANYYAAWGGVSPQAAAYPNNPHNDFLNVVVLMGVLGLIPFVALLWTSWQLLGSTAVRRQHSNPFTSQLARFTQSVFVILIVAGQFHAVMYMSYPQVLFFFLLGIVASGPPASDWAAVDRCVPQATNAAVDWVVPAGGAATIAAGSDR